MEPPAPTERLRFRLFREDDAPLLLATMQDAGAERFYGPLSLELAQRWVDRQFERYRDHGHGLWMLERRDDSAHVGDCGVTWQTAEGRRVLEVGYHIRLAERSKGYATEAARACVKWAFDVLGCDEITSIVHPENVASMAVAARIHVDRRSFDRDGTPHWLYVTTREAWLSG